MNQVKISTEISNPSTGLNLVVHQLKIANGMYGKRILDDTNKTSPDGEMYSKIVALKETTITSMEDNNMFDGPNGTLDNLVLPVGTEIQGRLMNIEISGGYLICYGLVDVFNLSSGQ